MTISRFDLNLFVAFDAIYTQQSLTKAAGILHVTQPAVSNALSRLRGMLDDPLFVRTPAGMSPTPLARSLIDPVRDALGKLDDCIASRREFIPATARQTFRLHATEQAELSLLPALQAQLQLQAPLVNMEVVFMGRKEVPFALASGNLHLALDAPLINQTELYSQPLRVDHYVCAMAHQHSLVDKELSLEAFLECPQIHVSSRRKGAGHIDLALRSIGRKRRIALRLQHYTALPKLLADTDYIAAIPRYLAEHWPLTLRPLPFVTSPVETHLFWHKNVDTDPANRWLRQLIQELGQTKSG